jgi:hypothetical protein
MNKNFLVFSFSLAITASSMSASFCVEVKKTYEKSFAMPAGGQVTVQGDEGFIKVNSWDRPEVHLIWTKRVWARNNQQAEELLELVEVRINQAENNLQVAILISGICLIPILGAAAATAHRLSILRSPCLTKLMWI